ncbi:MAG: hypothetical protein NT036_00200 [Candidatus Omnitrophica bacterium]|nr:hypothetical protein [Candidatus Omnitrophota bacterium]
MKRIFMAIALCFYIVSSGMPGYCQYTEGDDRSIEQTESQMGESLESEMSSEKSSGTSEMGTANEESSAGEPMTL